MTDKHRAPQAFVLPDQHTPDAKRVKAKHLAQAPELVFEPDPVHTDIVALPKTREPNSMRRFRWLTVLASALFTLVGMWAGLAIVELVESFFARSPWLGWIAFAVAATAGFAALAIILREVLGLWRLTAIENLQEHAARAINLDERGSAETACGELEAIFADRADAAVGLKQLRSHRNDILDPRDRVLLADSLLVQPLDGEAHKIIARRARRVTLLTTVTPVAALDILFVAAQNLGMLRELTTLYGGRPSTLATLKLARMVAAHLAVTGGLALSDNLIQHVVGKGLLGRLSARFGEGAVNGILTSRIGLAAVAVCRPIPRATGSGETLTKLLKEVLTFGGKDAPGEPDAKHKD